MTVPTFALTANTTDALARSEAEVVVVGTISGDDTPTLAPGAEAVDAALGGTLADTVAALGGTGTQDELIKVPTLGKLPAAAVYAVGLGSDDEPISAEQVRRASGVAARALAGKTRALTTLSAIDLRAAVEGTGLGAYAFTEYKSDAGDAPVEAVDVAAPPADGDHQSTLETAATTAEAVAIARDLVNTPPNDLFPASFADRASTVAQAAGIDVEVLDANALTDGGYGGILGVGGGSSRPPRLVRLHYKAANAAKKVALVGKGITFDTGGISLKPAANMDNMTSDMAGAAAVLATTVLAAKLALPVEVVTYLPLAENMPSGTAYRPGDVLSMYGGKTVEVLNTDAEGRLVLADAITRAGEDEPDYLVETSTLTGAQVVALGKRTAGVMGEDALRDRVVACSEDTGETAWPMPLPEHLKSDLDSKLADIANVTNHRWGGMLAAGIFLREFVAEDLPWAHIDIAGPSYNDGSEWGYTPKGASGVPVRTITALLADIATNG